MNSQFPIIIILAPLLGSLFTMIFYGILEEKVGKKTTYKFNKEILDLLEIKVTKEMNNKLEEINKFILEKKLD